MDQGAFSWLVQLALVGLGFASLLVKRQYESPRRAYDVWILDVIKQAFSGGCAHLLGIINSGIVDKMTEERRDGHMSGNHCSWYFIAFTLDTTFGVLFAYFGVRAVENLARKYGWSSLQETGRYGDRPDKVVWAKQMVVWCIITIVARMFVLGLMVITQDPLSWISQAIAHPFRDDPKMFLVLVMIGCPLCMNAAQLWVQDAFLRYKEWSKMPVESVSKFAQNGSFRIPVGAE